MKAVPSGVPTVEPDSSENGDLGGQETVVLFGDAALYHLYSESKIERLNGKNPQLPVQLSRDGRAYVRESDGSIRWLVAPDVGVRVPKRWGQRYRDFAGFEGRENGRTLKGFVTGIQD